MEKSIAQINFHSESIEFNIDQDQKMISWLIEIAQSHQKEIIEINYIFCCDEYLLNINQSYLDHDTLTDIITFPYSYDPIESDIYISIDRIKENAQSFDATFDHELKRVMAHGLLHLIGFNDKTEEEQKIMTLAENDAIGLF